MMDKERVVEHAKLHGAREADSAAHICDICALFDEEKPADVEFDAPDGYFTGDNFGFLCARCLATQGCYNSGERLTRIKREHAIEEILSGVILPLDVKWVLDTAYDDELARMRERVQSQRSGGAGSSNVVNYARFGGRSSGAPSEFARDVARRRSEAEQNEGEKEDE